MIYFQVTLKAKGLSILPNITYSERKYVFINFFDNVENVFFVERKKNHDNS